jgi:hypothetical protein
MQDGRQADRRAKGLKSVLCGQAQFYESLREQAVSAEAIR